VLRAASVEQSIGHHILVVPLRPVGLNWLDWAAE